MISTDMKFEEALNQLNLQNIIFAVTAKDDSPKWTLEKARSVEVWYRRFLFLSYKYPEKQLVPTKEIDVFWHTHILHTQKYMEDCQSLFGYYFHHEPDEIEDNILLKECKSNLLRETESLFMQHFGESPFRNGSSGNAPCSSCGSRCGGKFVQSGAARRTIQWT
jgi:hypothetical protein